MAVERAPELAERFRSGHEEALYQVWRQVCPAIVGVLAKKYQKVLARDRVEHLVLIALLLAWDNRADFDPARGPLAGWLYVIADHVIDDYLEAPEHQARRIEIGVDPDRLALAAVGDRGDAVRAGGHAERDELVRQAIEAVPKRQREVLLADMKARDETASTRDLAREMGVAEGTIRAYRERGMRRLEQELRRRGIKKFLRRAARQPYSSIEGQLGNGQRGTGNGEPS